MSKLTTTLICRNMERRGGTVNIQDNAVLRVANLYVGSAYNAGGNQRCHYHHQSGKPDGVLSSAILKRAGE